MENFYLKKHSQGKRNIYLDILPLTKEKVQDWESLVLQFPAEKALENSNYCLSTITYHFFFFFAYKQNRSLQFNQQDNSADDLIVYGEA